MNLRKLHQLKKKHQVTGYFNMKHILPLNEWVQLNESYFAEGNDYSHLREKGIEIMGKLINEYGFSEKVSAALTGNMFAESNFNPTKNGSFKGLIQWSKTRFDQLTKLGFGTSNPDRFTIDAQLKLIKYELTQTAEKGALPAIEKASTIEEAAYEVAHRYERCATSLQRDPKRLKSAKELYDLYKELQLPKTTSFQAPVVSPDDGGDLPAPE
jgi:hypothetical protein